MTNHWWWRPGVRPGRRVLVWHVLFDDQPAVHDLVRACQERLGDVPGLDPVPLPWLHMTTRIVGFADEIGDAEVRDIVETARARLRSAAPVDVRFGRPLFHDEGLALGMGPREGLDAVRDAVAAHRLDGAPDWAPDWARTCRSPTATPTARWRPWSPR